MAGSMKLSVDGFLCEKSVDAKALILLRITILWAKILDYEETKGVALVRYEDGTEKLLPKIAYLRMKKAGRKITLLKEGSHFTDLR